MKPHKSKTHLKVKKASKRVRYNVADLLAQIEKLSEYASNLAHEKSRLSDRVLNSEHRNEAIKRVLANVLAKHGGLISFYSLTPLAATPNMRVKTDDVTKITTVFIPQIENSMLNKEAGAVI